MASAVEQPLPERRLQGEVETLSHCVLSAQGFIASSISASAAGV